jgi:hypothetical protein
VQICAQLCSRIRLIYLTYGYLRVILYLTSKRAFLLQPRLNILALLLCTQLQITHIIRYLRLHTLLDVARHYDFLSTLAKYSLQSSSEIKKTF